MRVLHLGNIAGNGYQNAKFQRRKGIEAFVLSYNYRYCIGQPEWEDGDFDGPIDNPDDPDWACANLRPFERPPWFDDQTRLDISFQLDEAIFHLVRRQPSWLRRKLYGLLDLVSGGWHPRARESLATRFDRLYRTVDWVCMDPAVRRVVDACLAMQAERYRTATEALRPSDVMTFLRESRDFRRLLTGYDVIQAYSTDVIHAMLAMGSRPFTAFDHGNMRDIPWEGTPRGRMLALAYHAAGWCFLTNPDTISTARRIGLERLSFLPHPVDDELFQPGPSALRDRIRSERNCESIFFAPARHHWGLKGNDLMIRAFSRAGRRAVLLFCDWGEDVARSKALVESLGLQERVVWLPPLGKRKLREYYNASDLVLDQFKLGVFGSTVPEVMACARPVALFFNRSEHEWCFEEMPPVVNAGTEDELVEAMRGIGSDPRLQESIGTSSLGWFKKWHNWERVADQQIAKYQEVLAARR